MIKSNDMNHFIKELSKLYHQNPDMPLTSDTIYHQLMVYGLSPKEIQDCDIQDIFEPLMEHYRNSNLDVFVSEEQKGFLQVRTSNCNIKCVKMYLSFPKDKMQMASERIFDFIASNNITNGSKISRRIRSDSIVLRISDVNDADKVLKFINSDRELLRYAKATNPFSLKEGIVGISYDDMLSYNSVLSSLMKEYFVYLKNNNNLKKGDLKDFANFVDYYYNEIFITKNSLVDFTKSELFNSFTYRTQNTGKLINNFEQIIRIINYTVHNKLDKNLFYNFMNEYQTKNNEFMFANEYNERYSKIKTELLNSYISLATQKYGSGNVYLYLQEYLTGNKNAITNDNNFRQQFITYLPVDELRLLVNNDPKSYVDNYFETLVNKPAVNENQFSNDYRYILFCKICNATANKHGVNQLMAAIEKGTEGDYRFFTNADEHLRDRLAEQVNPTDIQRFIFGLFDKYQNENTVSQKEAIMNFVSNILGFSLENRTQKL